MELSKLGHEDAKGVLVSLSRTPAKSGSEHAVVHLAMVDPAGTFMDIYWTQARHGRWRVLRQLALYPNPTSKNLLDIAAATDRESSDLAAETWSEGREVQELYGILVSPDAREKILGIISKPGDLRRNRLEWAIRAARLRGYSGVEEAIRARLDALESRFLEKASATDPHSFAYANLGQFRETHTYDDLLIAFAEADGEPSELQRARLRRWGYCEDPEQRLRELIAQSPLGEY